MAKQIHYLIIATHLPSDSEILFFKTVEEAKAEFQKRTQGLFAVDKLEEDEDYWIEDEWAVRFNSGNNQELSGILGDVDHYFKVGTQDVEDDCDCYVADFSEHVDDVMITFFNKQGAVNAYNNMVDGSIAVHNECSEKQIDRKNENTWEDEDYGTLFMESDNDDGSTDAFFGVSDVYWTYRIGKVTLTK
jgi:hypothetical protein